MHKLASGFTLTTGTPTAGQYTVSNGVYTFSAADAGKTALYRVVQRNRIHPGWQWNPKSGITQVKPDPNPEVKAAVPEKKGGK
jgi:hypothetical protein